VRGRARVGRVAVVGVGQTFAALLDDVLQLGADLRLQRLALHAHLARQRRRLDEDVLELVERHVVHLVPHVGVAAAQSVRRSWMRAGGGELQRFLFDWPPTRRRRRRCESLGLDGRLRRVATVNVVNRASASHWDRADLLTTRRNYQFRFRYRQRCRFRFRRRRRFPYSRCNFDYLTANNGQRSRLTYQLDTLVTTYYEAVPLTFDDFTYF